jgi:hypothetical protein
VKLEVAGGWWLVMMTLDTGRWILDTGFWMRDRLQNCKTA